MIRLIPLLAGAVAAVSSPLDKVTEELTDLKETLGNVQSTLTSSLALIQDHLVGLDTKLSSVVEPRLASLDVTLTGLEERVTKMEERADVINEMRPHLLSLVAQVTSLGANMEKMTGIGPSQKSMGGNAKDVEEQMVMLGSKVEQVEGRLGDIQESWQEQTGLLTSMLARVEAEVRQVTKKRERTQAPVQPRLGHRRHRGRMGNYTSCLRNREILVGINQVVKETLQHVSGGGVKREATGPRFEYLRSEEPAHPGAPYSVSHEVTNTGTEADLLLKKIARPFKRVNSRIIELKMEMQTSNQEMRKDLMDFLSSSTEQRQEHTHMLEGQAAALASLKQCCSGVASDQGRLTAQAGPVLDRLDRWMTSWQNSVGQQFERVLQQNSYDHDSHSKGHKQLERLLVEGFDRCQAEAAGERSRHKEGRKERKEIEVEQNDEATGREKEPRKTTSSPPPESPVLTWESGCEKADLVGTGLSKVYRVGRRGDDGYNTRFCDQQTDGGGWTVIQRRGEFGEPRENFTRSWEEYKQGFGDLEQEFWWGNDKISRLTRERQMVLKVVLEAHDGQMASAEYDTFRVDDESSDFQLWVGGYTGNASDSLSAHNGYKFSTVDRNNDEAPKCCPCAPAYGGGWWFYSCFESNLNGEYFLVGEDNGYYRGIVWELWLGDYSLKSAVMMVRPRELPPPAPSLPTIPAPDP